MSRERRASCAIGREAEASPTEGPSRPIVSLEARRRLKASGCFPVLGVGEPVSVNPYRIRLMASAVEAHRNSEEAHAA